MVAIAIAATAGFILVEQRVAEPMLPLHVFKIRNFTLSMSMTFFLGLGLFGVLTFIPLYQQTVQGASPTVSGLLLTPMMVGSMVTSVIAGQLVTKTGKYKMLPIIGGLIMTVGMYLLSRVGAHTTRTASALDMAVLGLGMGLMMQLVSLISQNAVELKDMGVASSGRMFFQQIGGSLGAAAFGALFARKLAEAGSGAGAGKLPISGSSFDPATVMSLPPATREVVFGAIAHGVQSVFIWGVPAGLLVFLFALFIKEVPLRGRTSPEEKSAHEPELIA
jgi:predicted MFS family arabinose efflux permease